MSWADIPEMKAKNTQKQTTGRMFQTLNHSARIPGKKSEKSEKSPLQLCFLPGSS